jgi:hypothetical protein
MGINLANLFIIPLLIFQTLLASQLLSASKPASSTVLCQSLSKNMLTTLSTSTFAVSIFFFLISYTNRNNRLYVIFRVWSIFSIAAAIVLIILIRTKFNNQTRCVETFGYELVYVQSIVIINMFMLSIMTIFH